MVSRGEQGLGGRLVKRHQLPDVRYVTRDVSVTIIHVVYVT